MRILSLHIFEGTKRDFICNPQSQYQHRSWKGKHAKYIFSSLPFVCSVFSLFPGKEVSRRQGAPRDSFPARKAGRSRPFLLRQSRSGFRASTELGAPAPPMCGSDAFLVLQCCSGPADHRRPLPPPHTGPAVALTSSPEAAILAAKRLSCRCTVGCQAVVIRDQGVN